MQVGSRLGPYELTARLGAGGMGEVYKARDTRLDRTVAIKVLRPDVTSPDGLARFEREARSASALNHPNILTIHDVGREGDVAFIAMEWVDGSSLREVITNERLPVSRVIDLGRQLADGLAKAHAGGIVHRDLKPENVMVTRDGLAKIVDFGLAKVSDTSTRQNAEATLSMATIAGAVLGTVGYMSPEQASGRSADYRSDQFSLGLVLYELATRTRPFDRATVAQSLAATIEAEAKPLGELNPEVPPTLSAIVARCLTKRPEDRYDSTRDLARDLAQLGHSTAHGTPGIPDASRARRWARRAAAAAILVVALGAVWKWAPRPTPATATPAPLLAVRTFRNLSTDAAHAYLATGLSRQVHAQLSQLSGLRLLSRGAAGRYDGDSRRLADELKVASVLDGDVQVSGSRVRVAVTLIDASTQQTQWTESYDRDIAEVLAVQGDVALKVAEALKVTLTPGEAQRVQAPPTANPEAHQIYLKWMHSQGDWNDEASHFASLAPLRQALTLDPAFALAQAELAYQLALMGASYDAGDTYSAEAIAQAERALQRDPSSADAHEAMATAFLSQGVASRARLSFQRAIAADPNGQTGMYNLSILDVNFGRFLDGLVWARRGFERSGRRGNDYYHVSAPLASLRDDDLSWRWLLDGERRVPTHSRVQQELALVQVYRGDPTGALTRAKRTVETTPDNPEGLWARAEIAYLVDSPELEALTEPILKESSGISGNWVGVTAQVRYAYALGRRGDRTRVPALLDAAERDARQKIDEGNETPVWRTELAAIAALRGDHARALDALDRAYDAGYREYGLLEPDPILAPLRSSPRFRALLDRMRRDVAAQREAAREQGLLDLDPLMATPAPR